MTPPLSWPSATSLPRSGNSEAADTSNSGKPDPETYASWLARLFPQYVTEPFAPYHHVFWQWVWALTPEQRADAFVAIWPRGAGKSTSAELACASVAARGTRRYALYVCETQDQANQHVENVATLFESSGFGESYATVSSRLMGKFGNSRGWRVSRLRTMSGFTIDAIGLDKSARGIKVDDVRPDLIVLDDIDGELDTSETIDKKLSILSRKIIPTRSAHCAVLAVQNLVHADGIFARLADGRADFLAKRTVSGPHPAIEGLAYEAVRGAGYRITSGEPTWGTLKHWQAQLDEMGLTAFLAECQHEVEAPAGGMFDHLTFRHIEWDAIVEIPLVRTVVWVDPAVTDTDRSDAHGIHVGGIDERGTIYALYSWEARSSPMKSLTRALKLAIEYKASAVGVETDQGGDTWRELYYRAAESLGITSPPAFKSEKAGAGHGPKAHRASQMLADYEKGRIVHVLGTHDTLERALRRFPRTKPFDLVDAAFWVWLDLRSGLDLRSLPPLPTVRKAGWTDERESPWKRMKQEMAV